MKILTVIGARPQFIKAVPVSKAFRDLDSIREVIVHTGQHFDQNMSDVFFNELGLPAPDHKLNINSTGHGAMTGRMLEAIEGIALDEKPDYLLVYGDTNSTLAGALAAAKLHIPVAHVEAGLRTFNMKMPEEVNRILTDNLSAKLFCPTETAVSNLRNEGFHNKAVEIINSGDVMQDSAHFFKTHAVQPQIEHQPKDFALATIHRAENTDDPQRLKAIVDAINTIHQEQGHVIIPLHPRTRKKLQQYDLSLRAQTIDPVGFLEMLWLIENASLILTDSGGLQKEAFFFKKPCITLRDQTEWTELIEIGANTLVGCDTGKILASAAKSRGKSIDTDATPYGPLGAASRIAKSILSSR